MYFFEFLNLKIKSSMPENMMTEGSITLKSILLREMGKEEQMLELCKLFPLEM